jgi:hypothetical protein
MILLGFVLIAIWLALLTFALIGHNVRTAALRRGLAELGQSSTPAGFSDFRPDIPDAGETAQTLTPDSLLLLVSETCSGCNEAIRELARAAVADQRRERIHTYTVLTPNPTDERVVRPLRLVHNDELYRELYPGRAPALFYVAHDGDVRTIGVPTASREVRSLVRSAQAGQLSL